MTVGGMMWSRRNWYLTLLRDQTNRGVELQAQGMQLGDQNQSGEPGLPQSAPALTLTRPLCIATISHR